MISNNYNCPYCGAINNYMIEPMDSTTLIEDCQTCCQPIIIEQINQSGSIEIMIRRENE